MMYLEKAKAIYHSYFTYEPAPCTHKEIEELEETLGLKLPPAFVEYLLWMGKGADLLHGSEFFYRVLFFLREVAEEILQQDEFPGSLPKDAIVFFHHGGNEFMFLRTSQGEDPPVYFYGYKYQNFSTSYQHFSQYLETVIKNRGEYLLQQKKDEEEEALLTEEQKAERAKKLVAQTLASWAKKSQTR